MTAGDAAPRRVLLFTGHRVDAAGRTPPRFPATEVAAAAHRIAAALQALDAGPMDLAYTQGSSGGDLLFAEACLARAVPLHFLQPRPEPQFIEESVRASADGDHWVARYEAVRPRLATPPRALPDDVATGLAGGDPFVRCNAWLLATATAWGPERVRVVALWDGRAGAGPGGTADMVEAAHRLGLGCVWLDVNER